MALQQPAQAQQRTVARRIVDVLHLLRRTLGVDAGTELGLEQNGRSGAFG
jgi:hypothetical protein